MTKYISIFIFVLLTFSVFTNAQTNWTGNVDSDWNTAGNWDNGIPDANDDTIIPNSSAVNPIISGTTNALAKSLTIGTSDLLTINTGGSLTIDNSGADGILINGSLLCNGTINIDNTVGNGISITTNIGQLTNGGTINIGQNGGTSNITLRGISNAWALVNSAGGIININDTDEAAILNTTTGTINNFGTLKMGQGGPLNNIAFGIFNEFTFVNESTGNIQIDNIYDDGGILNQTGTFTNEGTISIGQTGGAGNLGYDGIRSYAVFVNETNATITIDNVLEYGLDLYNSGSFSNDGTITIGQNGGSNNIGYTCLSSACTFINNANGIINLDNAVEKGIEQVENNLTNNGIINIGQTGAVAYEGIRSSGSGSILNNANAFINIDNTGRSGLVHDGSATSNNYGTINIGQNGAASSITESGVKNSGAFINQATGQININNTAQHGVDVHNTTFDNYGTINTDKSNPTAYNALILSRRDGGTFNNKAGANLNLKGFNTGYGGEIITNLVNEGMITFENLANYSIDCIGGFTNTGTFKGNGIFEFNGMNSLEGTIVPGLSPGFIQFQSEFEFLAGTTLEIEVEGKTASQYDRIIGDDDITLAGTLEASISYTPSSYDRIVFVTGSSIIGTFGTVSPALPSGWALDYTVAGEVALVYSGVLPVELISFSGKENNSVIQLEWQTASETNNKGFDVQRSTNDGNWEQIGWVAGIGNTTTEQRYELIDKNPSSGLNYYRLKQVDFDGKFDYSNIIVIDVESRISNLEVYPNPTAGKLNFKESINGNLTVRNTLGQIVYQNQMETVQQLDLFFLPVGTYLLEYVDQDKSLQISKFVITKN